MKRVVSFITAVLLCWSIASADDYIGVNFDHGDVVFDGTYYTITFRLTYECGSPNPLQGTSNGFVITATGDVVFDHSAGDFTKLHDTDWWAFGGLNVNEDVGGEPDIIGSGLTVGKLFTGGPTNYPNIASGTVDEEFLEFRITVHGTYGQLCIDSSQVGSTGPWKFSGMTCGQGGAPNRPLFVDGSGSDANHPVCFNVVEGCSKQPPIILNPPDTLIGDNCNRVTWDFEADPGGGTSVTWDANFGSIDPMTGEYSFELGGPTTFREDVYCVNDCVPPESALCSFEVILENDKTCPPKGRSLIDNNPRFKRMYTYGPEGAESMAVWIEIEGSTEEVKALGIKLGTPERGNVYTARISVDQYPVLLKIQGVIRVTPAYIGGTPHSIAITPVMSSGDEGPRLDESLPYFFADEARRLYGIDGDSVIVGIIDQGFNPLSDDFYFGPWDSKILYYWDMDAPASAGGSPHPVSGRFWTKSDFDTPGGYSYVDSSDVIGHGTRVAGIAAGTGRETGNGIPDSTFTGVAPGAYMILVSLPDTISASPTDIRYALRFVQGIAGNMGLPCVTNLSWGFVANGPRNGSSELEREIQNVLENASDSTDEAFVFVVSAGNMGWDAWNAEVNSNPVRHAKKVSHAFGTGPGSVEFNVPSVHHSTPDSTEVFGMAVWYEDPICGVRLVSPVDSTYTVWTWTSHASVCGDPLSCLYYSDPGLGLYSIYNEVWGIEPSIGNPFPNRSSKYCEVYVLDNPYGAVNYQIPSGTWQLRIETSGDWDVYLFNSKMYGYPYCAQIAPHHYDPTRTLTEPGCTPDVITVASVNSKNGWTDCYSTPIPTTTSQFDSAGYRPGEVSFFSSLGPSRRSDQNPPKPEAYAPGAWIASTGHSQVYNPPTWLKAEDCKHMYAEGTSFSAPHVAGAIALALDLNPDLTADYIRELITTLPTVDGKCFNVLKFLQQVDPICLPGDVDANGIVDLTDIVYLIAYTLQGGPPPIPLDCCGNVNGSIAIDIDDIVYLIAYVFQGGPDPFGACHM